jgi:hypothetical protein
VNYDLSPEEHRRLLSEEKRRRLAETFEEARKISEVDPDAREAYESYRALPDDDSIQRQHDNVDRIIRAPDFDQVDAPARVEQH